MLHKRRQREDIYGANFRTAFTGRKNACRPPPLPKGVALVESFPALILAAGIFSGAPELPPLQKPVKFSAAAVANMILRPLPYEQCYEWTIGEAEWLPSIRGRRGLEQVFS